MVQRFDRPDGAAGRHPFSSSSSHPRNPDLPSFLRLARDGPDDELEHEEGEGTPGLQRDEDVLDPVPRFPLLQMEAPAKIGALSWNLQERGMLASAQYDGSVGLWDVHEGVLLRNLQEHQKRVWSCAFSPVEPRLLVSGGDDRKGEGGGGGEPRAGRRAPLLPGVCEGWCS